MHIAFAAKCSNGRKLAFAAGVHAIGSEAKSGHLRPAVVFDTRGELTLPQKNTVGFVFSGIFH
jgi:hypothetical protein